MKALNRTLLPSTLLILSIGSANAQTDKPTAQAAQSAASAASSAESAKKSAEAAAAKFDLPTNIAVGDRIKLRSNISRLTPLDGATGSGATVDTCLRVTRLNDNSGITVAVEKGTGLLSGSCKPAVGADPVVAGDVYKISGEQLKNASYARYGWIYGPMLVPFKYFAHDRSFEPSQSLGMYMGYRTSWFESRGLSWVASAGLATMKISQVVDDPNKPGSKTTKENTVAGYSISGGALFDLTKEAKPFVAGLMVGRDFVGRNSALTYANDNRTWIAIQIGWVQ
jgi:hypothetical protein